MFPKNYLLAKRHPIIAFLIDSYFIGTLYNLIIKYFEISLDNSLYIGYALLGFFIVYHAFLYKYNSFLSIGEMITGTILKNKNKLFINPVYINRSILWILFIATGYSMQYSFSRSEIGFFSFILLLIIIITIILSYVLIAYGYTGGLVLYFLIKIPHIIYLRSTISYARNDLMLEQMIYFFISLLIFTGYLISKNSSYQKLIKEKVNDA